MSAGVLAKSAVASIVLLNEVVWVGAQTNAPSGD